MWALARPTWVRDFSLEERKEERPSGPACLIIYSEKERESGRR